MQLEAELWEERAPALFVRAFRPAAPEAALVFVHASMVHSEYYMPWALALAERGTAVWLLDLRGHGRSAGIRGHVGSYRDYVDDIRLALARIAALAPGVPLYLGGESFGALMAFLTASRPEGEILGGLALCSPAFRLTLDMSPALLGAVRFGSRVLPRLRPPRPMGLGDASRDVLLNRLVTSDPLLNRRYTLRFFAELLEAQQEAARVAPRVTLPILAVLAGQDRITDIGGARTVLAGVPGRVHTVLYTHAWHSVVAEAPARVVQDVTAFILHTRHPARLRPAESAPPAR